MIAALSLVLAGALPPGQDHAYEQVQSLVAGRRFGEAWSGLQAIEDPRLAARAEADLSFFARDFSGSLAAAERGLALDGSDLFLLHRATAAALWLGDAERAASLAWRLDAAVREASLAGTDLAWWTQEVRDFTAEAEAQRTAGRQRDAMLVRARRVSLWGLGGVVLGMLLVSRRSQG